MLSRFRDKRRLRFRTALTPVGKLILFAAVFLVTVIFTDIKADQLDPDILEDCASGYFYEIVPKVIRENLSEYEGFQFAEKDSFMMNTSDLIGFKSDLEEQLSEKLNGKSVLWVPVGPLTQLRVLNGVGLKIPVKFYFSSSVSVDMEDECRSFGINQNVCSISAKITARMHPVRAGKHEEYIFESSYILYRREYSGETPAYYAGRN